MRKLWWRHAALIVISIIMLAPFYWLLKTAITSENIYEYPPHLLPVRPQLFNFVDVWYLIPFPRYLFNSIVVSLIAVAGNLVLNAMAGFALTLPFVGRRSVIVLLLSCTLIPFQATIIPAYLITAHLGLLDSYLGLALPLLSTIVCIFIFKASFDAVPRSLIDAARIDGLGEMRILLRVMLPLSTPAIATNIVLSFIWSWNNFLWPLIITRSQDMQTLPLGLARFLSYMEDTTGALYAFVVMVLAPGLLVFLMAQSAFMRGLTTGATKG
ncbi:carbohydrate ABC transporter permease [Acidisphaera sp. S103]|uniref:carbohydrate ABC transporter permease n=1 Tax=Acidisphaera sp. S103 TaxID=1747223 RepID=UPI00131B7690|nr:carbohydrate ABC transporter permease [Acidisphaera sp. S103]